MFTQPSFSFFCLAVVLFAVRRFDDSFFFSLISFHMSPYWLDFLSFSFFFPSQRSPSSKTTPTEVLVASVTVP